jgi:hypothetical protein
MKLFILALSLTLLYAPQNTLHASSKGKVIWIEEEPESASLSSRELRKRIKKLERAVAQLQRRVFELEYKESGAIGIIEEKKFTCYIETPFEGLFSETRSSQTEAKAAVSKTCSQKTNNSLYCKMDKVKCGE